MAENKAKPTGASVETFLNAIIDDRRRDEARRVVGLMTELTGEQPTMWGSAIIGFGMSTIATPADARATPAE